MIGSRDLNLDSGYSSRARAERSDLFAVMTLMRPSAVKIGATAAEVKAAWVDYVTGRLGERHGAPWAGNLLTHYDSSSKFG